MLQGKLPKNNDNLRKSIEDKKPETKKSKVGDSFSMLSKSNRKKPQIPQSSSDQSETATKPETNEQKTSYHYKANPNIPRPPKK